MKVCLDICCLKRPFDSQEQALVRLETEAVMAVLSRQQADIVLVRTPAQPLENALNPVQWRREAVELWLLQDVAEPVAEHELASRTGEGDGDLLRGRQPGQKPPFTRCLCRRVCGRQRHRHPARAPPGVGHGHGALHIELGHDEIARFLRAQGQWAAVFRGEGENGAESIVFGTCAKPLLRETLEEARKLDPQVVYSVEPILESGPPIRQPLPHPTGWRGRLLRK